MFVSVLACVQFSRYTATIPAPINGNLSQCVTAAMQKVKTEMTSRRPRKQIKHTRAWLKMNAF